MRNLFFISILFIANQVFSQKDFFSGVIRPDSSQAVVDDEPRNYAKMIQAQNMRGIIEFLASDSCEGRELGSAGNDRAAEYIAGLFSVYNIPKINNKSYFQEVGFTWMHWDKLIVKINGVQYKQLWDYLTIPRQNKDLELKTNEVVFLGYGIDDPNYSDYANVDVNDKVVLIYKGEPKKKSGVYFISGSKNPSSWSDDLKLKITTAKKHGAKLLLIIEDKFKELVDQNRQDVISPNVILKNEKTFINGVNVIHLSSTMVSLLLGDYSGKVIKARDKINKTGKPQSLVVKSKLEVTQKLQQNTVEGRNILAYFEGTDKKEELIIVTAHYDHIGKRGNDVFNGADDNASGTSAVIEIAHTLQQLKKKGINPRRSILCMLVTGEEKGLLGSQYYVNNPVFPLQNTIVNINVDMIGRTDDKYKSDTSYIYVIGSDRLSPDLHQINLQVNQKYSRLKLDHTYNSELDPNRFYYRSDHYNFAEKGIPAIFFFSGVHEDYHRITDDAHKILYGKAESIARHIFLLSWDLANREQKINSQP